MLTRTEHRVLAAIHAAIVKTGRPPSFRELAGPSGSVGWMHKTVVSLERRGYVRRDPDCHARAVEVIRLPPDMGGVCPTCGHRSRRAT